MPGVAALFQPANPATPVLPARCISEQMEIGMTKSDKGYEVARELTEKAMDAYVEREDAKGDKLVEKAKAANEQAVRM